MLTKLKLALGLTTLLAAGTAGLALANGGGAGGGFAGGKAKLLEKYDTNKDGVLDANEKAAMKADFQAKRAARRAERIAKLDKNGDGVLSLDEFKAGMGKMGRHGKHHMRGGHGGWKHGGGLQKAPQGPDSE